MTGGEDVSRETSTRARSVTRSMVALDPRDYTYIGHTFSESIYELLSTICGSLDRELRATGAEGRRLITLTLTTEAQVPKETEQ